MKVFYWTDPWATEGRRFYLVNTETESAMEIRVSEVDKGYLLCVLKDGFTEISATTAYKMGLPT